MCYVKNNAGTKQKNEVENKRKMETEENTLGVFLKYISKNMLERKGRLFLLIFSIMISVALLVASLGLIDSVVDSYVQPMKIAAEGKDIGITSNTEEKFFSLEDINAKGVEDITGELRATGVINDNDEVKYVSLVGRKSFDKKMVEGGFQNANDKNIIISDRIAKEYSVKVGGKLTIAIGGKKAEYTVSGIAANDGCFYSDKKKEFIAVVPYDYMNELLKAGGKYNYATAKMSDSDAVVKDAVKDFNDANEAVKSYILVDDTTVGTESITMGLYGMLALVCIVCVIIICGAFKLIITERLPIMGTFMSQGATRKKLQRIILMEAALYGVIGSVFGVVLGEFGLAMFTRSFAPLKEYGIYPPITINTVHIIIAVLFALILSVGSAWLPARSIKKLQVKDVILNRVETKHKKGAVRFIAGCVLLAFAIAGFASNAQWTVDMSGLLFFAAFLGIVMMSRKLLKVLSGIFAKLFRGNTTAFLAMNNIKSSKLLRGNITLLVVSLSAVFAIVSVGASMKTLVVSAYEELNTDYTVSNIIASPSETTSTEILIDKLSQVDGIDKDSVFAEYGAWTEKDNYQFSIMAAEPTKYAEYMQYFEFDSAKNKDTYEKYKNDTNKGILAGDVVAKKLNKKAGESVELEVNGKKETFNIVGTFDSKVYNNGRVVLMKPEDMMSAFNIKEAWEINFRLEKGADPAKVEKEFKPIISDMGATYMSRDDMMDENVKANQMIIDILSIFSYLALVITAIGILNNISISFQQRRKEFAVMTSVGMNAKKRKRLVLSESVSSVIWSLAIAVPFSVVVNGIMEKLFKFVELPMNVAFDWKSLPIYSVVALVVVLIATLSTMRKSKKLNVVAELKYE